MNWFIFKLQTVRRELCNYKTCPQNMWRREMFKYFGSFQLKQKHWWSNLEQESMKLYVKVHKTFIQRMSFHPF